MANVPSGREICEKQLFSLIEKMEKVEVDNKEIESYMPLILRKLEWIDKEELIKKFVSLEFNRFLDYYKNANDIDVPSDSQSDYAGRDRRERPARQRQGAPQQTEAGFTRLFINMGKDDGFYPASLIEMINTNSRGKRIDIGRIELMRTFSFFEVPEKEAPVLMDSLKKAQFKNRKVVVDFASAKGDSEGSTRTENFSRPRSASPRTDNFARRRDAEGSARSNEFPRSTGGESRSGAYPRKNDSGAPERKSFEKRPRNKYGRKD
jgi:ATP-dependent RNA helicase DeaD